MSNLHVNLAASAKASLNQPMGAILTVQPQGGGMYDVVAQLSRIPNRQTARQAVEYLMQGRFSVIAGTLTEFDEGFVRASVVPHLESKPHTEENVKELSMVTANVFMDADDNTWVVQDGRLVRRADEDYAALAESLKARHIPRGSPILATAHSITASVLHSPVGSYVYYLSPAGAPDFGILVTQASASADTQGVSDLGTRVNTSPLVARVVSRKERRLLSIPATAILESVEIAQEMPQVDFDAAPILDYYGQLFGRDSAFYKDLEAKIQENFS